MTAAVRQPTFIELFTPKLATVLREGYRLADLRADALSGLTVAIVGRLAPSSCWWPPLSCSTASTA